MSIADDFRNDGRRFELRYRSLSVHCPGYAFPCDAEGQVNLDALSEPARQNYFYARTVVGCELRAAQVLLVS
jgi:hypothetical protein